MLFGLFGNKSSIKKPKAYVLDTNVLVHDPESIFSFEENDVIIPFAVIRELDGLKNDEGSKGRSARHAIKNIKEIIRDSYSIGEGLGNLIIGNKDMKICIPTPKNFDNKSIFDTIIVSTAIIFQRKNNKTRKYSKVILVTKDQAVEITATEFGITAEDYKKDKTTKFESYGKIFPEDEDYTNGIHSVRYQILPRNQDGFRVRKIWGQDNSENKYFENNIFGVKLKNIEQECAFSALIDPNINVVSLTGVAGTGKTFLAILAALNEKEMNHFDSILVARPNISTNNEFDIGFLPGNKDEKLYPWMLPILDNIGAVISGYNKRSYTKATKVQQTPESSMEQETKKSFIAGKKTQDLITSGVITIQPLESIRGRSLRNTFFIVDESQNLTPKDIKTILTRCGEGTKIVFTGDLDQIDANYLDKTSNGLANLIDKFLDQENFCYINLIKVLRSKIAEQGATLL